MRRAAATTFALLSLVVVAACDKKDAPPSAGSGASAAPEPTAAPSAAPVAWAAALSGSAERGAKLVEKHECNRCHDGTGLERAKFELHCFGCHEDIIRGKFKIADKVKLAKWKAHVRDIQFAPSLEGAGARFEPAWLTAFLYEPADLRPNMVASMPRLGLSKQDAADIAAHLTRGHRDEKLSLESASAERGRAVLETRGCGSCHLMTGVAAFPAVPPSAPGERTAAIELAPDLRFTRERLSAAAVVRWLRDPAAMKPGTLMPNLGLSDQEAKDAAKYLLTAELAAAPRYVAPKKLALLERKVGFEEVQERVLGKICAHCHGNPDVAGGDGGPGNTGGFGFAPRRLDLSKYSGVASGYVGADGERHSVFLPLADGTPRLVAALYARHDEQAGKPRPDVRGMPLGMPALPIEDIQLVESWVAQGRPR
ncbi:MAG: c-type cytochrome [Polyangiaceae bacterium]|nr:c-type cytochrome [Polyangiaceae bacterium]